MDTNELFWATGIDNTGLKANQAEAIQIFTTLSSRVQESLQEILNKYGRVISASKVKFGNPVEEGMITGIKTQIESLGKSIDTEIKQLGNFSAKYDQSIGRISKAASNIKVNANSPLAPMVAGIQKDVASSTEQLSFLERRFKYAFGSMLAYGSVSVLKSMASEIIEVKTQFEFLQTAINSFAGSAEKGAKIMHELTQFAVNSPLQVNDITEAAKQLMAFGVGADNVVGQIKMLSDVASGSGKPIKEIAYIYGKSLTEGKVYTRTLMQFGNLGIPIYEALAKVMDTTPAKIKKMTQMGAVGFEDVKRAIESLTAAGGQYYGFSEKMMSTTAGLLSNVKDKWILAMKDMGESSDGFINGSVRLVDSAIANWRGLGDAIVVAATAVGSYQVAKTLVSMGNTFNATTANLAEVASLETLVSAETKAAIAKTGFVVGSEAYGKAIRKEVAALLAAATAEADLTLEREAATVVKLTEAETTLASATGNGIATAQENLNIAAVNRGIASREAKIAVERVETIQNGITTASEVGQAAGTDLVAAAKVRLIAITATLNRTMLANPYLAVGVALVTLVTIMWALHDSTTAAERAQKKLGIALDEIDARADRKSKQFSDNLDIIKNKSLDGTKAQYDAYLVLHNLFGAIIGDKTLDQLKTIDSTTYQAKANSAIEYSVKLKERQNETDKAGIALNATRDRIKSLDKVISDPYTGDEARNAAISSRQSANIDFENKRQFYIKSFETQKKFQKDYDASRVVANKKEEDDTYEHWSQMKKSAEDNIKSMGSRAMDALKSGTADAETKKYYAQQIADKKKAEEEMAKFPSDKLDKAATRASDLRNREAADAAKRLEAIRANNTELANLKSKAETDATQATIDAMDAGYAKEKAQQENNFEKKLTSLNSEKATILKKEQENISNIFRNMNPNKSKTSTPAPTVTSVGEGEGGTTAAYNSLLKQATAGGMTNTVTLINESLSVAKGALASYNSELDSAQKDEDAKLGVLLEKQLLEYGDYTAKKAKIEKDYSLTLAALEQDRARESAKGNIEKVAQIDSAKIQATTNQAKDQMALAFDQLKSTPEFAMAFEDLGNVSTATIEKLIGEMEKLKTSQSGALSLADYKVYAKELGKMTDEFIKRNPLKALKESADELIIAQRELEDAKAWQHFVTFREDSKPVGVPKDTKALEYANTNVEKKTDDVTRAQNKGIKATKEITDAYGKLSKEISSLGNSIGGVAGMIISSIGDIGSFVSSSISAWEAASVGAATAIQTVEKASIILAAISLVITIATKVIDAISASDKAREEAAQKAIEKINAVKNAWLEAHAAMTNKKFSNIFGDDVFGKATAQAGLMAAAAKNFSLSMDTFQKGDRRVGGAVFDVIGRSVNVAIEDFDILKAKARLAGMDVKDASYASLKSLIDSYESYQTYLDSVTSYLSSIFGQLGSSMMDSLMSNTDNMTAWADDVTGYISDSFAKMIKDMAYSLYFAKDLADAQVALQAIILNKEGLSGEAQAAAIQVVTANLYKKLIDDGKGAKDFVTTVNDAWVTGGGDTILGGTNKNSLTSAIKGMDQPTADILTAQFSALRIHGANMDVNISRYLPEISLSLQGQTNMLQIAFNDVAEIAKNTRDLAGIKSILSDIKTYGVKVL